MPFNKTGLSDALETLFADPPDTAAACAAAWADAVSGYMGGITPPLALPPQLAAAQAATAALAASLTTAFAAQPQTREQTAMSMEAAFVTYAGAIVSAYTLAPVYTAAPPTDAIGFLGLFVSLGNADASHTKAANDIAAAIHGWAITGTTTMNLTPFTTLTWEGLPPTP